MDISNNERMGLIASAYRAYMQHTGEMDLPLDEDTVENDILADLIADLHRRLRAWPTTPTAASPSTCMAASPPTSSTAPAEPPGNPLPRGSFRRISHQRNGTATCHERRKGK
jgi:hypothetical protein